ncbi:universal stress protein [candidate division WOR-3 bacterium]|nr:universal stress protein [candidate division WOR-3 bacterium]
MARKKKPKAAESTTGWLPLKRILCPVDQTPVSTSAAPGAQPDCARGHGPTEATCRALKAAEDLANTFCGEVVLVYVLPPTPLPLPPLDGTYAPPFDVVAYEEELRRDYQLSLERLRKERFSREVKVRGRVITGDPATEIVRIAKEENVDLIVMPTHGRDGLPHVFFGSVAEKVVRHAECPVLTLH